MTPTIRKELENCRLRCRDGGSIDFSAPLLIIKCNFPPFEGLSPTAWFYKLRLVLEWGKPQHSPRSFEDKRRIVWCKPHSRPGEVSSPSGQTSFGFSTSYKSCSWGEPPPREWNKLGKPQHFLSQRPHFCAFLNSVIG